MRLALGRWVIYMMVRVIYKVGIGKMGNLYDGTCDI